MRLVVRVCFMFACRVGLGCEPASIAWINRHQSTMASSLVDELKEARRNLRRVVKNDWYRNHTPLSKSRLKLALAIWWEADRQQCMAFRYLHLHYLTAMNRLGMQPAVAGDAAVGAVRPTTIPDKWKAKVQEEITSLTEADLELLRHPQGAGVRRQKEARTFLTEVSLVEYVNKHNARGHAVSTRAVLERKGMLLEPHAQQTHAQLQPLPRSALKWVAKWQRRHGLTRGRFRIGPGLTEAQKRAKVHRTHDRKFRYKLFHFQSV